MFCSEIVVEDKWVFRETPLPNDRFSGDTQPEVWQARLVLAPENNPPGPPSFCESALCQIGGWGLLLIW